jgi:hypothetical protein
VCKVPSVNSGSDTECRNCPIRISLHNDERGVKKARLGILAYTQWTLSFILHKGYASLKDMISLAPNVICDAAQKH